MIDSGGNTKYATKLAEHYGLNITRLLQTHAVRVAADRRQNLRLLPELCFLSLRTSSYCIKSAPRAVFAR